MSRNEDPMLSEFVATSSDSPSPCSSSRRATHPIQDLTLPLLDTEHNAKTRRRACVTEEEVTPRVLHSPTRTTKVPLKRCLKIPEDHRSKFSRKDDSPLYRSSGSNEATTCPASTRMSDDDIGSLHVAPDSSIGRMTSDSDLQSRAARSTVQVMDDGHLEGRRTVASFDAGRRITFGCVIDARRRHTSDGQRYGGANDDSDGPPAERELRVITCSKEPEWADSLSDSSDNEKNGPYQRIIRKQCRQTTFQKSIAGRKTWIETFTTDYATVLIKKMQLARCVWFSILYVADLVFKVALLVFLRSSWSLSTEAYKPSFDRAWHRHYRTLFWTLLPFQVLTTLLCIGLALADDSSTRLRKRGGSAWMLRAKAIFVVVFLGIFQFICVKKACNKYRAKVPIIIRQVEAKKKPSRVVECRDTRWEGFLSRQGTVRINLNILTITGVPYVLCLMHVLGIEWSTCPSAVDANLYPYIHGFYMFVAFGILVFIFSTVQGIVDTDVSVSWHVKAQTLFECGRHGSSVEGGKQFIYPLAHWLFRTSEITSRAVALVGISWLCLSHHVRGGEEDSVAKFGLVVLLAFDFFIGAILLTVYSPSRIQSPKCVVLYIVCSLLMFVANIVHFVDRFGFAVPAKRISRILNAWRSSMFVGISIWLIVHQFSIKREHWTNLPYLTAYSILFFVPGLLYWFLFFFFFRETGYDMYTLARHGNAEKLTEVLREKNSPASRPSIDSRTMDGRFDTALHLAARAKHSGVMETLIGHRADVNLRNWNGNTPLHVACRQQSYFRSLCDRIKPLAPRMDDSQKEIITLLLNAYADPFVRNYADQRPIDVVDEQLRELLERRRCTVATENARHTMASARRRTTTSGATTAVLNQRVVRDCSPDDLDKIFPHLHDQWVDEAYHVTYPPPARRNIAALIFHEGGAGYFDLEFLSCRSQRLKDKDLLLRLRLVETIGQGGFGEVVKVEDTSMLGTFYAMKIQKREKWKQAFVECEALQCVEHPHIVTLQAAFQTPTYYALLLEYCCTDMNMKVLAIETEFGRCTGLPRAQALRYGHHILLAMAYLHGMNFAYRDLKPQNVLLDEADNVKLADFGLAKGVPEDSGGVVRASIHQTGTRGFMPPRSIMELDASSCSDLFAADVFAFGMTLVIMLCGENAAEKRSLVNPCRRIFTPCFPERTVERLGECTIFNTEDEYHDIIRIYGFGDLGSDSSSPRMNQPAAIPEPRQPDNPPLDVALFSLLVSMISYDPALRPQMNALLDHEVFAHFAPPARLSPSVVDLDVEEERVQQGNENDHERAVDLEVGDAHADPLVDELDV